MVTANDLLVVSLGQIGHTKETLFDGENWFFPILNGCLAECKLIEDTYRRMNDLEPLVMPDMVASLNDELQFTTYVLLNVVAKGVSARLAAADNNQMMGDYWATMYENAKIRAIGVQYEDVEDYYRGGEVNG